MEKTEHELISELAFRIDEQEGFPEEMALDHWLRAERALKQLHRAPPMHPSPVPLSERIHSDRTP
jgi:hypothetical protein